MKGRQSKLNKFPGFPPEPYTNYWPYPRALNGWWYSLSGSEQKILDFILRHTWGFRKTADKISLSQFENGVRNLDKGVGISRPTIIKGIKGLIRKGFIRKIVRKTEDRVNKYNEYEVVKNFNHPSKDSLLKDSKKSLHTINDSSIKDKQKEPLIKNSKIYQDLENWFKNVSRSPLLALNLIKKYGIEKVNAAYKIACNTNSSKPLDIFFNELKKE